MRDYTGVPYASLPAPNHPDFMPRLRNMVSVIDYFLHDLSKGVARIENGQVPSGSGTSISTLGDDGTFFRLKGRPTNQVAFGGTAASGSLSLGSTANSTKGKIFVGGLSAYDESLERLGVGTLTPGARLHAIGGTDPTATPSSNITANDVGWGRYSGAGGTPITTPDEFACVNTADEFTTYIARTAGSGIAQFNLSQTLSTSVTSWTVQFRMQRLFGTPITNVASTLTIQIFTSNKTRWTFPVFALTNLTDTWVTYTATVAVNDGIFGGATANSLTFNGSLFAGETGYAACTYLAVFPTGAIVGGAISEIIQLATGQTSDLTEWQDAAGNVLAKIASDGGFTGSGVNSLTGTTGIFVDNIAGSYNANGIILRDGTGFNCELQISAALTTDQYITLPVSNIGGGGITLVGTTQTITLTNKTLGAGSRIRIGSSAGDANGVRLLRGLSTTIYVTLDGTLLSGARDWKTLDTAGTIPLVGNAAAAAGVLGVANLTAQGADIASTNLTNAHPAGWYRVSGYIACTTLDGTAGTVTVTISWTDDVGATTVAATQALTATGRAYINTGDQGLYLASGNITYAVTHTGTYGTSKYALRLRIESLG